MQPRLRKVCPGMTVGDAKLRGKLDAKYRTNPKMKKYFAEYYDLAAAQNPEKLSGVMSLCFTAAGGAEWIKWDEAVRDQLVADEKAYSVEKERARKERLDQFYGKSDNR
jgi:hypothetical protein